MDNTTEKKVSPVMSEHGKTWHIDDGTGADGGPRYHKSAIRRVFTPEYKLAILAEYDGCSETGEERCSGGKVSIRASSPTGGVSTARGC